MSNLHFIINPVAGKGLSEKVFAEAEKLLKEQGADYTISTSEYAGHSTALAQEAIKAGHACVIAVGGDGTVREVAMAMVDSHVPMGILPCGTGNDLSQALCIPRDVKDVLHVIINGSIRDMDAGMANGQLFFNVAGFGFDVDVLVGTEKFKKRFKGLTAYTLGLLSALLKVQLRKVHIKTDTEEFDANALVVEVCNGTHFGGGMNVAPHASPCDGLLDLCVITDVTKATILRVLTRFQKGRHTDLSICKYMKVKEVTVVSEPQSPMQLDGEIMESTPATFSVLPGKIKIKCNI